MLPHQQVGWGYTRSWDKTQPGQLTPADHRDIPHDTTSHSATKAGGRRRKRGSSELQHFSSQAAITHGRPLLS